MAEFTIISHPVQQEEGVPWLVATADDLDSIPTSVRAFDPNNAEQVIEAARIMENITQAPDPVADVLGRIAVSYGDIKEG